MSGFLDREDFQYPYDDDVEEFDPMIETLEYEMGDDPTDEQLDEFLRRSR